MCTLCVRRVKKCEVAGPPVVSSLDRSGIGCTDEGVMSRPAPSLTDSRASLIVLISAVLAAISSLAEASPPDPSWIPGIYDDADFDDVVGLVTTAKALGGPADAAALHLVPPATSPQAPQHEWATIRFSITTLHARAPPAP
jgi:hypothetical protein